MSDSDEDQNPLRNSDEENDEEDGGGEYEDEEEEDEEEYEEEEVHRSKKRPSSGKPKSAKRARKKGGAGYFAEEAEEAGDDEDADDEYQHERAEAEAMQREIDSRRHKSYLFDSNLSANEVVDRVKDRYRAERSYDVGADGEEGTGVAHEVSRQRHLPTTDDPSIWVMRCSPGSEQSLVLSIISKVLDYRKRGIDLNICSAFCTASKGFIYVESHTETAVRELVNGLRKILSYTMKKLPLADMTKVLTIRQSRVPIVEGAWARYKRGPYKGDLCKVVAVLEGGSKAIVRVVPRIDYSNLNKPGMHVVASRPGDKMPQKFFSSSECVSAGGTVTRGRYPGYRDWDCDVFNNNFFYNGLLVKEVKPDTTLDWENIRPELSELERFREKKDRDVQAEEDESMVSSATSFIGELAQITPSNITESVTAPIPFEINEVVQVMSGDLQSIVGRIQVIDQTTRTITLKPMHTDLNQPVTVTPDQIMKFIKAGDHVKVTKGVYAGLTGNVVVVEESDGEYKAIIITDGLSNEIEASLSNLVISSEVTAGLSSLGGYELYDLVVLPQNETAVVTRVAQEYLEALTYQGTVKQVKPEELRGKRNMSSQRSTAVDNMHNNLHVGDVVHVVKGSTTKQSGTIKHIQRGTLFLHSNSHHKNAGIFVVKSRSCMLAGTRANASVTSLSRTKSPVARGGFAPRGGRGGRGDSKDAESNKWRNATVRIKSGTYKGLIGHVVDWNAQHVRVELHAKLKKVLVEIDKVEKVGDKNGSIAESRQPSFQTAADGVNIPDTPRDIPATPRHTGSETPLNDGSASPRGSESVWAPAPRINPQANTSGFGYNADALLGAAAASPFMQMSSTPMESPYDPYRPINSPWSGTGTPLSTTPQMSPMFGSSQELPVSQWPEGIVCVFKAGDSLRVGTEAVLVETLDNQYVTLQTEDGRTYPNIPSREVGIAQPKPGDRIVVLQGVNKDKRGVLADVKGVWYCRTGDMDDQFIVQRSHVAKLARAY